MAELFRKNWFIFSVLIFLLSLQLIYGFLSPAHESNDNWLKPTAYLPKFQAAQTDNFLLREVYPLISSEYRVSSDVGNYLELAQNFNAQYFNGHTFLVRPLYSFLIFLLSLPIRLFVDPSYGIIFGLAIFLNFILITSAVLLFFSLLRKLLSFKVAFLSSILLIFSPYVHASLNQPLAEMLMVFAVAASAYLLYDYSKKPSIPRLIVYSLIVGIFMLGKMFFAISFFILLLAVYFRRYKEGLIFLIVHLIPTGLWYLWVTQAWHIPYSVYDAQHWGMGIWLLGIFHRPWLEITQILLSAPHEFIRALNYGFLLIPVIFSIIGLKELPLKSKNVFYFGALFSMLAFLFVINLYYAHHAFLLFPIIYPTAALGINRIANYLKRYGALYSPLFYIIIIGSTIFISNINIYRIFDYLK